MRLHVGRSQCRVVIEKEVKVTDDLIDARPTLTQPCILPQHIIRV